MSLPNDIYGHTVTMTTDGITDTYLVGDAVPYSFPAGTSQAAVYLSIAKQTNLTQFNSALTEFINNKYNLETRFRWMALYLEFQNDLFSVNKYNYVKQLLAWGLSISQYTNTYVIAVMTLTDPNDVIAKKWDFSAFDVSDPHLTLMACMQIVG